MSKIGQNLDWFGFEVWLESNKSILFGSYRSQDLTNTIDKHWQKWYVVVMNSHLALSIAFRKSVENQKKWFSETIQSFHFNYLHGFWAGNRLAILVFVTGTCEFRKFSGCAILQYLRSDWSTIMFPQNQNRLRFFFNPTLISWNFTWSNFVLIQDYNLFHLCLDV